MSKEQEVRETLQSRPASIIQNAPMPVRYCFAGLFNGAKRRGWLPKGADGDLFVGKAECEWDWRETWTALRDLGLITWEITEEPGASGPMTYVQWNVTENGWHVRDDDIAYFRALMSARRTDEAA